MLTSDLPLQTVVTDLGGEQATRTVVIHARSAEPVQVVGGSDHPREAEHRRRSTRSSASPSRPTTANRCAASGGGDYVFAAPDGNANAELRNQRRLHLVRSSAGASDRCGSAERRHLLVAGQYVPVRRAARGRLVCHVGSGAGRPVRHACRVNCAARRRISSSSIRRSNGSPAGRWCFRRSQLAGSPRCPQSATSSVVMASRPQTSYTPERPERLVRQLSWRPVFVLQGRKPGTVRLHRDSRSADHDAASRATSM